MMTGVPGWLRLPDDQETAQPRRWAAGCLILKRL